MYVVSIRSERGSVGTFGFFLASQRNSFRYFSLQKIHLIIIIIGISTVFFLIVYVFGSHKSVAIFCFVFKLRR